MAVNNPAFTGNKAFSPNATAAELQALYDAPSANRAPERAMTYEDTVAKSFISFVVLLVGEVVPVEDVAVGVGGPEDGEVARLVEVVGGLRVRGIGAERPLVRVGEPPGEAVPDGCIAAEHQSSVAAAGAE